MISNFSISQAFKFNQPIVWLIGITLNAPLCVSAEISPPVSGRHVSQQTLVPADPLARIQWIQQELELIRLELGKPAFPTFKVQVENVTPREVYYASRTLLLKSSQLASQHLQVGQRSSLNFDINEIRPYHVWLALNLSLEQIHRVKQELKIPEKISEKVADLSTVPNDVFKQIIKTNHAINLLLDKPFSPNEVFQQLTFAVHQVSKILEQFPGNSRIPPAAKFERYKTPNDVYQRLQKIYQLLSHVFQYSGLEIVKFETEKLNKTPSDVFDLINLMVAQLTFLNQKIDPDSIVEASHYPGRKTPSDVFQRSSILLQQLQTLNQQVTLSPDWLQ